MRNGGVLVSERSGPGRDYLSPRLTRRERCLLALSLGGLWLGLLLSAGMGAIVGRATAGAPGAFIGGTGGFTLSLFAIQRFVLGESWVECGCIGAILSVCWVLVYFAFVR